MNSFEFICKKRFNEINNDLYMYKHSSGLSLYYYPNMTSNSFSIVTRIKENDTSEVFHILEHMLCRGNKNNKHFDLASFFKKFQDAKFKATTNFSNVLFQFENKNVNNYFGLANALLENVFNPSLSKEDFWIEGYSVRKNNEGIPTLTGRVYNEVKDKNKRDIDVYRNFIASDITNEAINDILNVSYEDVLSAYKNYFVPENIIIISSGSFKPELLLEKLDESLSKYTLNNFTKNIISNLTIKNNTQTVEHTFVNVKESNKIDASLFYKIEDLSYNDKSIASIVLTYLQKYKLEEIENNLKKDDKDVYLSTQVILDEKGYNFFNLRIFNIDKQNIQTIISKVKKSLLETNFNIEELKELILNKQIELDERYNNNSFAIKELISYLISSKFDLVDYNENLECEIINLLSSNNCMPFKEAFNRIINENHLHTYIFKNETSDILEDKNINYNENIDEEISKYVDDKNSNLENVLDYYLNQIDKIQIPNSLLLSTNDYISKRKFKETKIILSNDDSNLTFEKDLLVYLLSLGIKSLLDDIDYIYKTNVEARNGQIKITVLSDNNDTDVTNRLLNIIKDTDFNNYKSNIIDYASNAIELIKYAFNKQNFIFSTVSNLARDNSFKENSLCFLELENKLSFINKINFNEVKDYLFNKKDLTNYNLVKKNYSNVLFLTNRSNITSTALNIKDLSLSVEESKTIEFKLKEILELEIKQKRGLYGYYVQCSHNIFMIGIICDNNYNESLSLITRIMNSFSSCDDILLKKLSASYLNNINNLKTCVLLNKKDATYKKGNFDLIYEFDD